LIAGSLPEAVSDCTPRSDNYNQRATSFGVSNGSSLFL
jgi:hypothetical protein